MFVFAILISMNIEDVEKLAELARIELSADEKKSLLKDFDSILAYVDTIKSAEIGDEAVKPNLYNVWREDRIEPREFSRESIVGQFPEEEAGYLKVKKIL